MQFQYRIYLNWTTGYLIKSIYSLFHFVVLKTFSRVFQKLLYHTNGKKMIDCTLDYRIWLIIIFDYRYFENLIANTHRRTLKKKNWRKRSKWNRDRNIHRLRLLHYKWVFGHTNSNDMLLFFNCCFHLFSSKNFVDTRDNDNRICDKNYMIESKKNEIEIAMSGCDFISR